MTTHLVSRACLVPVMALAQRAGLGSLVEEHARIGRPCGVNTQVKVACLVAGMIAGAGSIDDMIDVAARTARHGRGHLTIHLPEGWHREQEWASLFQGTTGPPAAAA